MSFTSFSAAFNTGTLWTGLVVHIVRILQ